MPFLVRKVELAENRHPDAELEGVLSGMLREGYDPIAIFPARNTYTLPGEPGDNRDYSYAENHIMVVGRLKSAGPLQLAVPEGHMLEIQDPDNPQVLRGPLELLIRKAGRRVKA